MVTEKQCARCKLTKSSDNFWRAPRNKDGLESWCKQCHKERGTEYRREKRKDPTWKARDDEAASRYKQTEKWKVISKEWAKSEKGIESRKRYQEAKRKPPRPKRTEEEKHAARLFRQRQYFQTEKGKSIVKASQRKYYQTEKGLKTILKKKQSTQTEEARAKRQQHYIENRERVLASVKAYYQTEQGQEIAHKAHVARRARKRGNGGSYTVQEWKNLIAHYNNTCLCCGIKGEDTAIGKLTPDHVVPLAKGGTNNIDNIQPLCLPCNISKRDKIIDYRP